MARVSAINDDGISKISRIGGEAFIPIKPTAPKELKRILVSMMILRGPRLGVDKK